MADAAHSRQTSGSASRLFSDLVASLAAPLDSAHPDSLPAFNDDDDNDNKARSSVPRSHTQPNLLDAHHETMHTASTTPMTRSSTVRSVPAMLDFAAMMQPRAKEQPEDESGDLTLRKFTLYETRTKVYVIGSNHSSTKYRVLKIDRTPAPRNVRSSFDPASDADLYSGLSITEDPTVYTQAELDRLIETLKAGNLGSVTRLETVFYGIAGFVRFTSTYYMVLIKSRSPVALIGGNYVYHCEGTVLRPISPQTGTKSAEEARLLAHFQGVDLSKNFYFSYTYNLTQTLQTNMTKFVPASSPHVINDKWVWNTHLLKPAFRSLPEGSPWLVSLIHGFIDQTKLSIFGRTVYLTLIARRSRHFAGARFLKRGINAQGWVANDVETEQIVCESLITPLHVPAGHSSRKRKANPRFTSFVQVRGSIPLYWTQENVNMSPKPPIELAIVDPYFSAAAVHFDDLLGRHGAPITVLNLIKQKERAPRESKLLGEFKQCIDYLNQFLPEEHRIGYIAWDLAAANRQKDQDVIGILEDIGEEMIEKNKFFHSGPEPAYYAQLDPSTYRDKPLLQSGVVRTNCIDCIDRTNAAQFTIAKEALGHQLRALGVISDPRLAFDCEAVDLLTEMYHDHGDTIALQYGGSHLVNTMETYRKLAQWSSHSRDLIENLKRYYSNSFIDAEKQVAIDLFLGIEPASPFPGIKEISAPHKSYRHWYTPEYLNAVREYEERDDQVLHVEPTDFWHAYYRPRLLTDMSRHFAFKVNSSLKYTSSGPGRAGRHSPFLPRPPANLSSSRNRASLDANNTPIGVRRWLSKGNKSRLSHETRAVSEADMEEQAKSTLTQAAAARPTTAPSSIEELISRLLEPSVPNDERAEYASYVAQFDRLSLSQSLSEKDASLYRASAAIARDPLPRLVVSDASKKLYVDMCNRARP